jgi:thiol-disulfide isomerase/thioredoxin
MKQITQSFLLFGLVVCGAGLANAHEWTIDGTTKVEAEFSGIIGDTVFLSKADGSEQKVSLASLSADDQAFIKDREQATTSVVTASPPPPTAHHTSGYSVIANLLTGKLVVPDENGFADYMPNSTPDYYAIYFSAGWCGPCHRFTPKLVNFYQQMKTQHSNFEVIFVSNDRNEHDMLGYMHELSMPWPAVRFAEIKSLPEIKKYEGRGIPCLVIVDAQGNVVADSFVNGRYVGAESPMNRLGKLLDTGQ